MFKTCILCGGGGEEEEEEASDHGSHLHCNIFKRDSTGFVEGRRVCGDQNKYFKPKHAFFFFFFFSVPEPDHSRSMAL